ncbi:unnamed protein product [Sphagnum jensenii]|uniref:Uncharacterized protein n=1 Tax=Sphagnum jensenii TaxID=128206 RepID=A0ABP1AI50_9BRYO
MRYVVNRNPASFSAAKVGARGAPPNTRMNFAIRSLKQTNSIGLPLQTDRYERLPNAGLRLLEEEEETVPKPLASGSSSCTYYIPLHKQLYKLIS